MKEIQCLKLASSNAASSPAPTGTTSTPPSRRLGATPTSTTETPSNSPDVPQAFWWCLIYFFLLGKSVCLSKIWIYMKAIWRRWNPNHDICEYRYGCLPVHRVFFLRFHLSFNTFRTEFHTCCAEWHINAWTQRSIFLYIYIYRYIPAVYIYIYYIWLIVALEFCLCSTPSWPG